ncbi:MAG: hypothetical protein ACPGDB_04990, partial [Fusobacterium sp.]
MSWNLPLRLQDLIKTSLKNPLTTTLDASNNNIENVGTLTADIIDMNGGIIENITDPVENQDAATKNYVDNLDPPNLFQVLTEGEDAQAKSIENLTSLSSNEVVVDELLKLRNHTWIGNLSLIRKPWAPIYGNSVVLDAASQFGSDYYLELPTDSFYVGMIFYAYNNVSGIGTPAFHLIQGTGGSTIATLGPLGSPNLKGVVLVFDESLNWRVIANRA